MNFLSVLSEIVLNNKQRNYENKINPQRTPAAGFYRDGGSGEVRGQGDGGCYWLEDYESYPDFNIGDRFMDDSNPSIGMSVRPVSE